MSRPALVRIVKSTAEAYEVTWVGHRMVPMEWWWVRVIQDGEVVRSGGAPTLPRAIQYMRHGLGEP